MRRKTVVVAAAIVSLVASLAFTFGCKNGGGSQNGPGGSGGGNQTGEIVIGHYASMTGDTAHFGQDTDKAVRLAVEEVNAQGGIKGRRVKLVTLDTRGDATEAANAVTRLIDVEHVSAIIGEVASTLSLAGGRVAQRRGIPMVSPSSTNPAVTAIGNNVFRVCFIDPFQGTVMAKFARENLRLTKVAIIKDVRSDYSIGLAENFRRAFTQRGGQVVAEQSYSAGDTDFSAQLTAIRDSGAEAIFVPGYYGEVGAIAVTKQRLGINVPLLGGDGWDAPDLFRIGGAALEGSFYSNHFAPDAASDRARRFISAFQRRFGSEPTGLGALGYDAAMVLFEAMRRAQSVTPATIREGLTATRNFEGVTGRITINAQRDADKSAVVLRIRGGRAVYETTVQP
ncbi:MAG: ABC transporter substrate-binding protein [Deltaproteobacteria bacterium]|nr:ABC transporter substrate-binding protein [Deltaproteobacteria bacterium]